MPVDNNPLKEVAKLGQSIWLDSIRRGQILSGELKRMIDEDGLSGETANPSIFEKAIGDSADYDAAIAELAHKHKTPLQIYETLAIEDVRMACDVFRPTYDGTDGADGYVSIEVSPKLAYDTQGTIVEAKRFFKEVHRPNVMIKIPGTPQGVPAIEECLYQGLNINVTLLFSLQAHEQVAWAYVRALERRAAEGKPVDRIASVASFFVSRIDTLADQLIQAKIRESNDPALSAKLETLGGKVAVANAKMAYQLFKRIFGDPRFKALANKGARVQRPLWASTSTKNPHYPDTLYVDTLIGPDTVNTLPIETITAFQDHGRPRLTIEEDLEGARRTLSTVDQVGLSLDAITAQVLEEGVIKFDDALEQLLRAIESKAKTSVVDSGLPSGIKAHGTEINPALDAADGNRVAARVWNKDAALWKADPAHQAEIRNRLGWLTVPSFMRGQLDSLKQFGTETKDAGFTSAVLCGMGGSSLCVEVMNETLGSARGYPKLHVLDTTDPAAIRSVEKRIDLAKTLFFIASKSGETVETLSHFKYFYERVKAIKGDKVGESFVAITDAGSGLEKTARQRGFRRIFQNPADIGGRYSALSYFGLAPAAVMGIDLGRLLDAADGMVRKCGPGVPSRENPGTWLGVVLAALARQGHDKITFAASPGIESFGAWTEQLIAESTGKEGHGLVPIDGEPVGSPSVYGHDRVFVYLRLEGARNGIIDRRMALLEKAGQPVIRLELADPYAIGAEFFRWEFAVAVAGALIGIDAFDQPNVQESKENTQRALRTFAAQGHIDDGTPEFQDKKMAIYSSPELSGARGLRENLAAFFKLAQPGDYVAFMAYLEPAPKNDALLQQMRTAVRDALHVATTVGYGPRFLHSTGQLHKGGPNKLLALQITADNSVDVEIPGESYTFGRLKHAQAFGDWQSLKSHGRRCMSVHFMRGAKLDQLVTDIRAALLPEKRPPAPRTRRRQVVRAARSRSKRAGGTVRSKRRTRAARRRGLRRA